MLFRWYRRINVSLCSAPILSRKSTLLQFSTFLICNIILAKIIRTLSFTLPTGKYLNEINILSSGSPYSIQVASGALSNHVHLRSTMLRVPQPRQPSSSSSSVTWVICVLNISRTSTAIDRLPHRVNQVLPKPDRPQLHVKSRTVARGNIYRQNIGTD